MLQSVIIVELVFSALVLGCSNVDDESTPGTTRHNGRSGEDLNITRDGRLKNVEKHITKQTRSKDEIRSYVEDECKTTKGKGLVDCQSACTTISINLDEMKYLPQICTCLSLFRNTLSCDTFCKQADNGVVFKKFCPPTPDEVQEFCRQAPTVDECRYECHRIIKPNDRPKICRCTQEKHKDLCKRICQLGKNGNTFPLLCQGMVEKTPTTERRPTWFATGKITGVVTFTFTTPIMEETTEEMEDTTDTTEYVENTTDTTADISTTIMDANIDEVLDACNVSEADCQVACNNLSNSFPEKYENLPECYCLEEEKVLTNACRPLYEETHCKDKILSEECSEACFRINNTGICVCNNNLHGKDCKEYCEHQNASEIHPEMCEEASTKMNYTTVQWKLFNAETGMITEAGLKPMATCYVLGDQKGKKCGKYDGKARVLNLTFEIGTTFNITFKPNGFERFSHDSLPFPNDNWNYQNLGVPLSGSFSHVQPSDFRVVLQWPGEPKNLDLHLVQFRKRASGLLVTECHAFYANPGLGNSNSSGCLENGILLQKAVWNNSEISNNSEQVLHYETMSVKYNPKDQRIYFFLFVHLYEDYGKANVSLSRSNATISIISRVGNSHLKVPKYDPVRGNGSRIWQVACLSIVKSKKPLEIDFLNNLTLLNPLTNEEDIEPKDEYTRNFKKAHPKEDIEHAKKYNKSYEESYDQIIFKLNPCKYIWAKYATTQL